MQSGTLAAGGRILSASAKAPAGSAFARAEIYIDRSLGRPDINIGRILFKEKNTSEMIVNGAITADHMNVTILSAITANIGIMRTATSGERLEIRNNMILVYDANNVLRVRLGEL